MQKSVSKLSEKLRQLAADEKSAEIEEFKLEDGKQKNKRKLKFRVFFRFSTTIVSFRLPRSLLFRLTHPASFFLLVLLLSAAGTNSFQYLKFGMVGGRIGILVVELKAAKIEFKKSVLKTGLSTL